MRIFTRIFALLLLGVYVLFVGRTTTSAQIAAEAAQKDSASPHAPRPELGIDVFAQRLMDDFYRESPEEVEEVSLSTIAERDLILDNLAHLPGLRKIEFSEIAFSKADFEKIAAFPQVKQIHFYRYQGLDPAVVSLLKSLEGLRFSRCSGVDWRRLQNAQLPALRSLEFSNAELTADDLLVLADISTIENVTLSSLNDLDDGDLKRLGHFVNLKSLSVYNCRNVRGAFLEALKDRGKLREFRFTGTLPALYAQNVSGFAELQSVFLNIGDPLAQTWFDELAANCKQLKSIKLIHQAVDKQKVDRLSSLVELNELQIHSSSEHAGVGLRSANVEAAEGAFTSISQLRNLKTLRVSGRYTLNAEDGAAIASLSELNEVELRDVVLQEGVFAQLDRLVNLRSLSVHGSRGLGPAEARQIGTLGNLEVLNLSNIATHDADFSALKGLSKLKELDVRDYRGLTNEDMAFAEGTKNLEELRMKNNFRVNDQGIAKLQHATGLRELWITRSRITGTGFADWPADHSIESIFIEGSPVSSEGFAVMSRFQNLASLEVRLLRVFGGDIEFDISCFAKTPSLDYLAILGSYSTTQDALDKLEKARPKLSVTCKVRE